MKRQHYQTLGIQTDATEEEIKNAYRNKAKETHPDKNDGDDRGFAEVNRAYEVLSDPEKRKRYDETGDDKERNIQQEVTSVILGYAMSWIDQVNDEKSQNMVDFIKTSISAKRISAMQALEMAKKDIKKYRNALERIKRKDGKMNMIGMALTDSIERLEAMIPGINHNIDLLKLAMEEADNYSYLTDARTEMGPTTVGSYWGQAAPNGIFDEYLRQARKMGL